MAYEVNLEDLIKSEEVTQDKILSDFFTTRNINLKTEINAVSEWVNLETIANKFSDILYNGLGKKRKFPISEKTLKDWCKLYKEIICSKNNKRIEQVGNILKASKEQANTERSLWSRLTGGAKEL